jgi:hypothetical protein
VITYILFIPPTRKITLPGTSDTKVDSLKILPFLSRNSLALSDFKKTFFKSVLGKISAIVDFELNSKIIFVKLGKII